MTVATIYPSADAMWQSQASTFSGANSSGGGTITGYNNALELRIGCASAVVFVYAAALTFDTSALGSTAIISAEQLDLYGPLTDGRTTNFTVEVRNNSWDDFADIADFPAPPTVTGTLLASIATSTITSTTYWTLTENGTNLRSAINLTGSTRMTMVSDRNRQQITPTTDEYMGWYSSDSSGTANDPKLTLTYTVPQLPNAPTALSATNTTPVPKVSLSWTAPAVDGTHDAASTYKVERAPDVSGSPGSYTEIDTGVAPTSDTDTGVVMGAKYWYRVRATNAAGDGAYSTATSVVVNTVTTPTTVGGVGTVQTGKVIIEQAKPATVGGVGTVQAPTEVVTIFPATVGGVGTVQAPRIVELPTPATVGGVGTVQTPVEIATVKPTTVGGVGTVQSPPALAVTPSTVGGVGTVQGPTIVELVLPATVGGVGTVQAPTEIVTIKPATNVAGVGTVQGPTIVELVLPATVGGVGTVQAPTEVVRIILAANVGGVGTVQAPTTVDLPSPATVPGVGTVQAPTEIVTIKPTTVGGVGTVQTPVEVVTIFPATVPGVGTVQAPLELDRIFPATVGGVGTVQVPLLVLLPTPSAVTAVGTVQVARMTRVQIAAPDGVVSNIGWVDQVGSTTTLYTRLSEAYPDDSTYITVTI